MRFDPNDPSTHVALNTAGMVADAAITDSINLVAKLVEGNAGQGADLTEAKAKLDEAYSAARRALFDSPALVVAQGA